MSKVEKVKITRVEVIDDLGRQYLAYPESVELSFQDGGRTLKVFVKGYSNENHGAHRAESGHVLGEIMRRRRP